MRVDSNSKRSLHFLNFAPAEFKTLEGPGLYELNCKCMYTPRENKDWRPRSTAIMDFHMKKKLFYAANNLKEKGRKYNFLRYGPKI